MQISENKQESRQMQAYREGKESFQEAGYITVSVP